jgi:hypothetical protein
MSVIYILQDGKHLNTNIYKIGKTTCINGRLSAYSKNTILHQTYKVEHNILDKTERKIKNRFSNKFTLYSGQEWFRGDIDEMKKEITLLIKEIEEEDHTNVCSFCYKEFSSKVNLLQHQRTVKSCLKLQGKHEEKIECENCKKSLACRSYKQHKVKCDVLFEKKKQEESKKIVSSYENVIKENKNFLSIIEKYKLDINFLEKENEKLKYAIELLEKQNEKLQSISTSVTMKLAEKVNSINYNHNNNTVTKELTPEEIMSNVIETGGTVYDFVDRYFRYNIDEEETDEQFTYRRKMEDLFRKKKKEWRENKI